MQGYTTREAAELLGLTPSQIRGFARAGLLSPRRNERNQIVLSFQDIVLLRTAKELMSAEVSTRRIKRALQKLHTELPQGRPLSALRISSAGHHVVIRERDVAWEAETGQATFDFDTAELAEGLGAAASRLVHSAQEDEALDADDWYDLALDLEAVDVGEAIEAYNRALALDPEHDDSYVNLGRLQQDQGELSAARAAYQRALDINPHNAIAAFNLGTVFEDLEQGDDALQAYQLAIDTDPSFVNAHFNLARLYELRGDRDAAMRHLRNYRALTV